MQNTTSTKHYSRINLIAILLASTSTLSSNTLIAENLNNNSETKTYEEVIVTAQKREQRLIDVPVSISAISETALETMRIQGINDLAYIVPNLNIKDDAPNSRIISIRGVGNGAGSAPLVGIYLDEIPLAFDASLNVDVQTFDIERVEVLKGPQGTLYGQGSVGGVVRFVTKRPSFEGFSGQFLASYYNTSSGDDSEEFSSVVNIPIVENELALRLSAIYKNKGGWFELLDSTNSVVEENFNDNELSNFRIRGLWQPSSKLEVDASAVRHKSDSGGANYSNTGNVTKSQYRLIARNDLGRPPTDSPYEYNLYNITIDYDFGFATFVSSTSIYEIDNTTTLSLETTSDLFVSTATKGDAWSQELRIVGSSEHEFDWVVGLSHTQLDRKSDAELQIYLSGSRLAGFIQENNLDSKITALFGDISYDLNDAFTVSFGARSFKDDRSEDATLSGIPISDRNEDFEKVSLKGSASYAMSENANIYFSISEGFRSGGLNTFVDTAYKPETVLSYELGAKALLLDRRLTLDGALYRADYNDYQALEFDYTTGQNITSNPGEVTIQGVEFAAQFKASEQLSLGISGNWTDTEFVKVAPDVPADFTATPPFPGFTSPVNKGDPINFIAKYSYSVYSDYNFNWRHNIKGTFHIDYTRQGPSTFTERFTVLPTFNRSVESPAVGFLNANISAQWTNYSIKMFGRNLNNERRETTASALILPQNRPRTIGVEVLFEF